MTEYLPKMPWRDHAGLKSIISALKSAGGDPRIVGGAVRDSLLGDQVSDIDIATRLVPEQIVAALESGRIKAVPTGIEHGTITAICEGKPFEITTLRRDVATDGRRAVVAFSTDWKEDAERRDFTINALYADPDTGEVFDYFGGLNDLENRHVRFIGNATNRIAEDHLRILRYFRFFARFGEDKADPEAIAACAHAAKSLMALSRERIANELLRILALPRPLHALTLMAEHGIFANFLPELAENMPAHFARLQKREAEFGIAPSPLARLIAILTDDAQIVDRVAMRLKLSNRMRGDLAARIGNRHPAAGNIRDIAYHDGVECARDCAMLYATDGDLPASLGKLENWTPPEFPVKGRDIIARGIVAGPLVAKTLKSVENAWISAGFPTGPELEKLLDQALVEAKLSSKN